MRCLTCHYDLKNLTEHRCPECGRDFNPTDPKTFWTPESKREAESRALPWIIVGYGALFAIGWAIQEYLLVEPVIVALVAVAIGMVVPAVMWIRSEPRQ